ncbi:ArsR/SmtB family transcription factor [Clostridium ganghwense]|uniref:Metalloregulator ArsR/SmtB family transcription factor n=1 Tax=Clostridium ganghwense TaxID=312089 RepID=A0ABT4CMD7_9CLOT|nr:metalloregulator ArsR/SmtB family transcription factor [Clostridium ganghwense]MCY6370197.1 metalloregulator ArsR/SmtB family transcription factor [Clostridium ganghwense]
MKIVQIMKVLSDETRIRILNLLRNEKLCVCEIEHVLNITQSNASRHLNKLKREEIIKSEKIAQWVYHEINKDTLAKYPFINLFIYNELNKIEQCKVDLEKLKEFKESGLSCEDLTKRCKR